MSQAVTHVLILEDQPEAYELLVRISRAILDNPKLSHAQSIKDAAAHPLQTYDLALIDLRLPDGLSCDFISHFKVTCPDTPAIVTTLYSDDDLVFAALSAGADGYLLKSDGEERLTLSFKRMLAGEPPISPAIARKLMRSFGKPKPTKPETTKRDIFNSKADSEFSNPEPSNPESHDLKVLTPREIDVLTLISKGLLVKQAAAHLGISHHTVNDNIKSIYRKLGINSRAEATLHASRGGLV